MKKREHDNVLRLPLQPKSPLTIGTTCVELGDALNCYSRWARPTAIVADGPYGLGKFEGEPKTPDDLAQWYEPHVAGWSRHALPETTLWFWCSEVGWAEVHPVLKAHGWKYRAAHVWDKGIGHVAGNCNGDTIRGFPVVTEVCVQYVRDVRLPDEHGELLPLKVWLRHEWQRSGLPLSSTNKACGVKNAATRKYFTQCHLWYFPPPDKMNALAAYAEKHGRRASRPYFSLDGRSPFSAEEWARLRAKWNHAHGITNVWTEPAIRGAERLKGAGLKAVHINQKPLKLIERLLLASTDPGDTVWEPFGGLFSTAAAAIRTGRRCYGAELNLEYYSLATQRLRGEAANVGGEEGQHRGWARQAVGALQALESCA
jgi:site-specific DNA-methyltransferase (adenine-specific)